MGLGKKDPPKKHSSSHLLLRGKGETWIDNTDEKEFMKIFYGRRGVGGGGKRE